MKYDHRVVIACSGGVSGITVNEEGENRAVFCASLLNY